MSPSCNHVSSTSEVNRGMQTEVPAQGHSLDLTTITTDNLIDNLSSISMEAGEDSANMVINDMSSMLDRFHEENRYLNLK